MVEIQILTQERIFELLRNQIKSKEIASITELEQSAQLVRTAKRFYKLDFKYWCGDSPDDNQSMLKDI